MTPTRREELRKLAARGSYGQMADAVTEMLAELDRLEAVAGKLEAASSRLVNPLHNRQAIENAYRVLQEVAGVEPASAKEKKP